MSRLLKLSSGAERIINILEQKGYQAYAVGGCVRDLLLGLTPADWDIASSALPQDIMEAFNGYSVIPTGIKHGTVTVIMEGTPFEITTFRTEGRYVAHRRPEKVNFVSELKEDLRRRDFTLNAMAYNPSGGLYDFFGGEEDLKAGVLRCVGEASERFWEDALRIMRALRFASVYGFQIEKNTGLAVRACAPYLKEISAERLGSEFNKFLLGRGFYSIMQEYAEVVYYALDMPEVGQFRLKAAALAPNDLEMRLGLLFESGEWARRVLKGLRYDNKTIRGAAIIAQELLKREAEALEVKKMLNKLGAEYYFKLLSAREAYERAAGESPASVYARNLAEEILSKGQCVSLKQLAVKGGDLREFVRAPAIGSLLNALLEEVMQGGLPNSRELLLKRAGELAQDCAQPVLRRHD